MRFVCPLAAGVAVSGGSGIGRTGAAARCGVGVVAVPAWAGIPWRVGLGGGRRSR
jgi:hypothetical protein